jgi:hypothetical protein
MVVELRASGYGSVESPYYSTTHLPLPYLRSHAAARRFTIWVIDGTRTRARQNHNPQTSVSARCWMFRIKETPARLSARLQDALSGVRVVSESPRRDAEGVSLPEYSA